MIDIRLSTDEIVELEIVAEHVSLSRKRTAEEALEYALNHREEFEKWLPQNILDYTVPPAKHRVTADTPRGFKEAVDQISIDDIDENLYNYSIIRAMVRFSIFEKAEDFQLNAPKTAETSMADPSVLIDEEEGKQIIEDDILGLGSEEPDNCSICGENEVYVRGMCEECANRKLGL